MTKNEIQEVAFKMIGQLAEPKFDALTAFKSYLKDRDEAKFLKKLQLCEQKLGQVGQLHLDVIKQEAQGKQLDFSLILLHAEDQFMTIQLLIEVFMQIATYQKN